MIKNYFESPISKRFIDAFPKFKREEGETENYFFETWEQSPFFIETLTEDDLKNIYNHLLAEYYNWHFIYLDDLGISLNVMKIIKDYFPNTKERLKLVEDIRNMSIEEFKKSGIGIQSTGSNPKIAQNMEDVIDLVDSQTANYQLKSKEQTIKAKFMSLFDDVFKDFTDRFKPLFVKLYSGVNSYLYCNEEEVE